MVPVRDDVGVGVSWHAEPAADLGVGRGLVGLAGGRRTRQGWADHSSDADRFGVDGGEQRAARRAVAAVRAGADECVGSSGASSATHHPACGLGPTYRFTTREMKVLAANPARWPTSPEETWLRSLRQAKAESHDH